MNSEIIPLSSLTEEETRLVSAWREISASRKSVISYLLSEYGLFTNEAEKILYETTDKLIEDYIAGKTAELNRKWERIAEVLNHIGNRGLKKIFIHSKILAESGFYWKNENSKKWYEEQKAGMPAVKGMIEMRNFINEVFQRSNEDGKERALSYFYLIANDLSNWSNKKEWKAYCRIEANANKETAYRDMITALNEEPLHPQAVRTSGESQRA